LISAQVLISLERLNCHYAEEEELTEKPVLKVFITCFSMSMSNWSFKFSFGLLRICMLSTAQDIIELRRKLYESIHSKKYFSQIFQLFNEEIRPNGRSTFLKYDGLNNTFNLAYEILKWKVHIALLRSHNCQAMLGFSKIT
jgi:hypothetical protein